jgi:hypothetical protein
MEREFLFFSLLLLGEGWEWEKRDDKWQITSYEYVIPLHEARDLNEDKTGKA